MTIRLLFGRVSAEGSQAPGDEINLPDDEAERLLSSGQAERVECATVAPQERAARKYKPSRR